MSSYDTPEYRRGSQSDTIVGGSFNQSSTTGATPSHSSSAQAYGASLPQYHQHSASPAPIQHPHQYAQQAPTSYTQPQHTSASSSHHSQYTAPANRYPPQINQRVPGANLNVPRPQEVWHLPENANLAIPEETRNQFQQDAQGHVLWWTAPPAETLPPAKPMSAIQHTARYLGDKARAKKARREKRKADGLPEEEEDQPPLRATKKFNLSTDEGMAQQIEDLKVRALEKWNEQMQAGNDRIYQRIYGEHWEVGKVIELEKLAKKQADYQKEQAELEASRSERLSEWEKSRRSVTDSGIYKDDYDPRY